MDDLSFFDSALSDTEMDELLMSCKKEAEQKKRKEASATEHQKKKKQKKQKKVKDLFWTSRCWGSYDSVASRGHSGDGCDSRAGGTEHTTNVPCEGRPLLCSAMS